MRSGLRHWGFKQGWVKRCHVPAAGGSAGDPRRRNRKTPRRGGALRCSFFFSSRRRHTRCSRDWSSDVCSSDLSRDEEKGPHGEILATGQNSILMDMNSFVWVSKKEMNLLGGAVFSASATLPIADRKSVV